MKVGHKCKGCKTRLPMHPVAEPYNVHAWYGSWQSYQPNAIDETQDTPGGCVRSSMQRQSLCVQRKVPVGKGMTMEVWRHLPLFKVTPNLFPVLYHAATDKGIAAQE